MKLEKFEYTKNAINLDFGVSLTLHYEKDNTISVYRNGRWIMTYGDSGKVKWR